MDTLPDFGTYDIFRRSDRPPDLDRIEAALTRSEMIALGLTARFPENRIFTEYLDSARRGLAALPEARAALAAGDLQRLDEIAAIRLEKRRLEMHALAETQERVGQLILTARPRRDGTTVLGELRGTAPYFASSMQSLV